MNEQEFKDNRSLKYVFTRDELQEISTELANKTQEQRSLEDEKKSITSTYGSRINEAKEQISQAANKVASGYDLRQIDCKVEYHVPKEGVKTLTRLDIDENRDGMRKEWTEKMNSMDYNLWTQYQEYNAEVIEGREEETTDPNERIESAKSDDVMEVAFEENPVSQDAKELESVKESGSF